MIASRDPLRLHRAVQRYEVNKPDPVGQKQLWKEALGPAAGEMDDILDEVAEQFRLSAETIVSISAAATVSDRGDARWPSRCHQALECLPIVLASPPRRSCRENYSVVGMGRSGAAGDAEADAPAVGCAVAPPDEGLRKLGVCGKGPPRSRPQRAVLRSERNGKDAGRGGARRRTRPRSLSHRSLCGGQQVHRRDREEPEAGFRRRGRPAAFCCSSTKPMRSSANAARSRTATTATPISR